MSKLTHSAIPELLGVINEEGLYGFVLELKLGTTIKDMLFKQRHIFTNNEIYMIGSQLINIIRYLKQNSIIHRDAHVFCYQ
ncbi:protein kinase [Desulfosporosinus sp.]|uniref:protein kinase n=1 Tax=Desulfosporosinus sp. TaxID=157907 RepID=UPI0026275B27|nr:protein kinase [Desulfosporosinus sp.]